MFSFLAPILMFLIVKSTTNQVYEIQKFLQERTFPKVTFSINGKEREFIFLKKEQEKNGTTTYSIELK